MFRIKKIENEYFLDEGIGVDDPYVSNIIEDPVLIKIVEELIDE